jgi:hypothetical protein
MKASQWPKKTNPNIYIYNAMVRVIKQTKSLGNYKPKPIYHAGIYPTSQTAIPDCSCPAG